MFDDFFIRALVAGIGVAFVTGPLGCFVIWRRLSYFGDTLAHSALLGVTLAFTMEFNIALSVFIISSLIALTLIQLQKRTNLPGDALLGLLAHSSFNNMGWRSSNSVNFEINLETFIRIHSKL